MAKTGRARPRNAKAKATVGAAGKAEVREPLPQETAVPWLQATPADLGDCDFEAPIAGSTTPHAEELSLAYGRAARAAGSGGEALDTPEARLFAILSAVLSLSLKPHERDEPFGPIRRLPDGSRSAAPEDFFGAPAELLAEMSGRATSPVVKARLADLCWFLDRSRVALGALAVRAYVDIVEALNAGSLSFRAADDWGPLDHDACGLLRRALEIGRSLGRNRPESSRARETVARLRRRAFERSLPVAALWFCELDLDFGASDPATVAVETESFLAGGLAIGAQLGLSLRRLAARAHHLAKNEDAKNRCLVEASQLMADEAERIFAGQGHAAAMLAAQSMMTAIGQLHGVPGLRERRTTLTDRLVDMQARILEEMPMHRQSWDVSDIAGSVQQVFSGMALLDQLFLFAELAHSPEPAGLVAEAEASIRQHPLSSLFATEQYDTQGKVMHRSAGGGVGDANDAAVAQRIADSEALRRNLVASAKIEAARQVIVGEHAMTEGWLGIILERSPFVPADRLATFCRAFLRFFQGDYVSALYILTPLLENSLRHILRMSGHVVSTVDDATQTQRERTISQLFEQMRAELDEMLTPAIAGDLERVFLIRPGAHLRHDIAHGLAHDAVPYGPDARYACWLIYRLCLICLLPYREEFRELFG